jgi:hypothetical protein
VNSLSAIRKVDTGNFRLLVAMCLQTVHGFPAVSGSRANRKLRRSSAPSQSPLCLSWNHRWSQPGQQQGRRFPSLRLEQPHSTRRLLVSGFLADSIQDIHSLRASGVISSHAANASESDESAFFKSGGNLCTGPLEILFCDITHSKFMSSTASKRFSSSEVGGWNISDQLNSASRPIGGFSIPRR